MSRANMSGVPEDELRLAAMLAEVRSRNLGWCKGSEFKSMVGGCVAYGGSTFREDVTNCCAIGAEMLVLGIERPGYDSPKYAGMYLGNDRLGNDKNDYGPNQDLGWAYNQAMTVNEEVLPELKVTCDSQV